MGRPTFLSGLIQCKIGLRCWKCFRSRGSTFWPGWDSNTFANWNSQPGMEPWLIRKFCWYQIFSKNENIKDTSSIEILSPGHQTQVCIFLTDFSQGIFDQLSMPKIYVLHFKRSFLNKQSPLPKKRFLCDLAWRRVERLRMTCCILFMPSMFDYWPM
jgi:hypothetical protein